MRIAITADPYLPVPPRHYGGIERIVDLLARGLAERGHEVTLFAHPESATAEKLIAYGAPPHRGARARITELLQVGTGLWRLRAQLDVIHSFGRLAALWPVLPLRGLPKVQSYQRAVPWRGVAVADRLAGRSLRLTACSASLRSSARDQRARTGRWETIPNGVETARYQPVHRVPRDAPLVFLGRLEPIKGPHHAIAIARAAGRRLVIAGNRVSASDEYFERRIAPHLAGDDVVYMGPVDDEHKSALLGAAAALLMPVEWDEPFGIVMAEALACGTPVIGFDRGAVPEVVADGANGFVVRSVEEAARAVGRLSAIDRAAVRADCEARFDAGVIVDRYEALYRDMVAR